MSSAMLAVTHDEHGRVVLVVEETGEDGQLSIPVVMEPASARELIENLEKHIQMAEARSGMTTQ